MQKIKKLLVANRGEIAIRALRAASELGIRTVAVYTYEDRYSLHRYKADEGYQIGPDEEPLKPYLDIEEILRIAKENEADAIHPGYGFLSENVRFVKRCKEENIIFIGPAAEVMEQLGDKVASKIVARSCNVPVIEDNHEDLLNSSIALKEAERIGFPVMLKASAGGGGRGMRVLHNADEFEKTFNEARREAMNAFGNDTMFLEKFVDDPKHIEVQLLGDEFGNIVHLYERDCSVQRRFQKVVEVAPATSVKQEVKDKLYEYALLLAHSVNYNNAGTAEFLVDKEDHIYFIEVNPRIQVEHTVTEEITGIDIVRSQILIADGKRLDSPEIDIPSQQGIPCHGVAIQCRITTEDPQNNFKPDYGTIIAYRNAGGHGIRIDEGSSYQGVRVSPFFDSMLAKVTAHGKTLKGAAAKMYRTLTEYRIRGVKTNIPFLEKVITNPVFAEGNATVKFIEKYPELFQVSQQQDRGTKVLRYLAEVMVNGNKDVTKKDPSKVFQTPKIPDFNHFEKLPSGTKQQLNQLGPEKFSRWLKDKKEIQYTDTTFRDAHQSLLATRVRTRDMLAVAESFAHHHPEVFSMEVWGGATFDVALRFLHECPWKRLQLLRKAIPNILFQMLIRGNNAIGYSAYPDNLVERFIEESWNNGVDIFRIFDSLNWTKSMSISVRAVRERTNGLAEACICYTGDITDPNRKKYTLQYYLGLARELEDMGAHILGIKDMSGLLKPYAAQELVSELKKVISIPIHLHTHDTAGIQAATYLKAIEAGVDVVDLSLGALSGLTSQPNFNSVVEMMRGQERELKMDIDSLNRFSNYWETVREFYYPFESGLMSGMAEVYKNEIPGGQYSNLKPQAAALGLADRMDDIKKAYEEVNELFGDIVKVTPSSKVVGDMAMYMISNKLTKEDVISKGADLSFPESVKGFFRGEIGQPPGGFPKKLQKIVLKEEMPFTDLPNAHLQPIDFDSAFSEFQLKFDSSQTFLDFLSYQFYPKVFEEYYEHQQLFGDVTAIPTPAFFYGLKSNEEVLVEIGRGKTLMIRLLYVGDGDENGIRTVYFRLNGQTRTVEIKDRKITVKKEMHQKAKDDQQLGAPLQGMLSRIFVKEGEAVKKNQPLFIIEAMKMETTFTAPRDGVIKRIALVERTLVEADDLVMEF
ncbi:MAG: pyruvate carboxylase [Chitinophagales bacterium]|nr:pyruvate carboxylase [Chitinophagales bacterium]